MEYDKLSKYLNNPEYYLNEFQKAQEHVLYDYSIILLWKTFILFSYEKIQQVRKIVGDDIFNTGYWDKGSLKCSEDSTKCKFGIKDFMIDNIYLYSILEDEQIIDLMCRIFSLEKNYKQLLVNIKNDRNTAAHVASEILISQKSTVQKNFDDLLKVVAHIDQVYKTKFFRKSTDDIAIDSVISESDLNYLVDMEIVPKIIESDSFDKTEKILKLINKKIYLLSCENIKNVLCAISQGVNTSGYNQALDLSYAYQFIFNLLKESYKKECNLNFWKDFYIELSEKDQERFVDIKKSIEKRGIKFGLGELKYTDISDIPF